MKSTIAALAFAICTLTAGIAVAESSEISVEHVWARASPKGSRTGAAYVTLVNSGTSDDRLLSVSSPSAASIEIHSHTNDNGVMKMELRPAIELRAGAAVTLKPGGMHLMMIGLKQQLKEGDNVPMTLTFEKAGVVMTTARVGKVGAMDDPRIHADGNE